MRIFFTTDVHGSDRCFRKFLNAAKAYKADTLILGGDITGKVLIPIIEVPSGKFELEYFGKRKTLDSQDLEETRRSLQDAGQYSVVLTPAELEELSADSEKMAKAFDGQMKSVAESWINLADERLRGTGVVCYVSPGNDDKLAIDEVLRDSEVVVNPENKVVRMPGGNEMVTLGYANPTPWNSPREVPEEKLGEMIEALATRVEESSSTVYNLHVPPIGTELDKAPAVTPDFKYVREGLGVKTIHVGSSSVRSAIERHSPLLGLHGHIHESKGFVQIGKTLCLNPGSEYSDGILRGALVNLEGRKVKDFLLTSG